MKTLTEHMVQYAGYHRDRRNLATHFVGIPMIVLAVAILLSRPGVGMGALLVTPAMLLWLGATIFYLMLDLSFGVLMAVLVGAAVWMGGWFAAQATGFWLGWGAGLFVVGWAFQFVGHYFEGRKPAFVDDLVGLLIGPLFLVVETAIVLGFARGIDRAILDRTGPTHGARAPTGA